MSYCDLPWFPMWVDDWRTSRKVKAVPRHIRSMYFDCLIEIWVDGPITDDESLFCSLLGADPKSFGRDWAILRPMLTPWTGGTLSDDKLEEVRLDQLAKAEKQRKRAQSRWEKEREKKRGSAAADASGMPRHNGGNAKREERSEKIDQEKSADRAGARVDETGQSDERHTLSVALCAAWPNAGLHGLPSTTQMDVVAAELVGSGISADLACRTWAGMIQAWKSRGVVTKILPVKMAEHLRAGLLQPVARGEVKLEQLANNGARQRPAPIEPPKYKSIDTLEDDLEANRKRHDAERAERDRHRLEAGGAK